MQPRVLAATTLVEPHPLMLLPFVTMLLCIAWLPFILKHHWEANYRLVALFFLGIFLTMVPVLDYMQLHARDLAIDTPAKFYWITGALSAVLDNAPTYLTFFANVLGRTGLSIEDPAAVREFLASGKAEMAAISMGAVLFGAATYIGNSPNFMIKAIAEQHKMHTPSFVGFVTKFSLPILLPVLFLVCWLTLRG